MRRRTHIVLLMVLSTMLCTALTAPLALAEAPRMDVVFLIDTTGSMGDEIAVVKESIVDMITEIESGKPTPDVRFGLVLYRDRGDEYITKTFELTRDTDGIIRAIRDIRADGGGDTPESVNEALHEAVRKMNWDKDIDTEKTIFLIGDAEPHYYEQDWRWQDEVKQALDDYIIINAIGCSGLSSDGVSIFTDIAKGTEGTFQYLTYKREYMAEDGTVESVMIAGDDYYVMDEDTSEELWRMGAEEAEKKGLAAKTEAPTGSGGGLFAGAPAETTMMETEGGMGGGYYDSGDMENNLDSILIAGMKSKMMERGVTYGEPMPYTVISSGAVGATREDADGLFGSEKELNTFLTDAGIDVADVSGLDFDSKTAAVFVAGGDRGLGALTVSEVRRDGDVITVTLTGEEGAGSPYLILGLPTTDSVAVTYLFLK
ncbi:MAG: VWA domain-containing protein [Deltaproteobacteria bacterium]|nr:VWA domain-containing protein [Candidatus Zymogenaceae bacterium]